MFTKALYLSILASGLLTVITALRMLFARKRNGAKLFVFLIACAWFGASSFMIGGKFESDKGFYSQLRSSWHQHKADSSAPKLPAELPKPWTKTISLGMPPSLAAVDPTQASEAFSKVRNDVRTYFHLPQLTAPITTKLVSEDKLDGGIVRRLLLYKSFDGVEIPVFHLFPENHGPDIKVIMAIPGNGDGVRELTGYLETYQHNEAVELAKAGYYVVAPAIRGQGYLGPPDHPDIPNTAIFALNIGSSFNQIILNDLTYAIATVDPMPARFGVTGVSMGGLLTVLYSAADPRAAVVVSMGFDNFKEHLDDHFDLLLGRSGDNDSGGATNPQHVMPLLDKIVRLGSDNRDLGELALLIAPRPWLMVHGDHDPYAKNQVTPNFTKYWAAGDLQIQTAPGEHEYFADQAIAWFKKYL